MDINLMRTDRGGDPARVRESQRRRFASVGLVDRVIAADIAWRKDQGRRRRGELGKAIAAASKSGDPAAAAELRTEASAAASSFAAAEEAERAAKVLLDGLLDQVGNLVHASVPVSNDEADNEVLRTSGEIDRCKPLRHEEVLRRINGFDPERGALIAGHRGYYLKGPAFLLLQALTQYALAYLVAKDYLPVSTPVFMTHDAMEKVAQLSQFADELYKIEDDDKYLIATSEQPLAALHLGQWIDPRVLPIRYAGHSMCFRKEAGAHGRDVTGIFRVHQFEKIEQFLVTRPEDSWAAHEDMIGSSEHFYRALDIPYRVITIVSGELNLAAAKKYDLEGWFPGSRQFRELVSCSNCTDYQARKLNARLGPKPPDSASGGANKIYAHMLNATLCATGRTLCAILENHQTDEGVRIPDVLQPFYKALVQGKYDHTFIPFVDM